MIDSIIAGFLRANKRLVVPGLGSFIRKDGGETVFVEFLKKDDGVLSSLIAREYGLDTPEAAEALEGYADGVRRAVAVSGRYVVDGVGVLRADANGLLELEPMAASGPDNDRLSVRETIHSKPVVEEMIIVVEEEPEPVREPEPAHVSEPEVVWQPEPEPEPVCEIKPEPVFVPEPVCDIKAEPEKTPEVVWQPEPEPVRTPESTPVNEKKTFTLNDLYTTPTDEPEFGGDWFGGPVHRESAHKEPVHHKEPAHREPVREHRPLEAANEHHAIRPPHIRRPAKKVKSRIDIVMVIAIVAAVIALASLFLFTRNGNVMVRKSPVEITDSTGGGIEMDIQEPDAVVVE